MTVSAAERKGSSYWVPMLGHAFRVLETFYEAGLELSLQEVSTRSSVNKTSALRILYTLSQLGYVDRNELSGKYRLGYKITEAARRAAGRSLVQVARPYMRQLHAKFDETVNLAVLRNHEIVYVEIIESGAPFRMVSEIGARVPMHATALGKAIAAFLPEPTMFAILERTGWQRFTPRTIGSVDQFQRAIAKVRQSGYAIDNEENEIGAFCIAAPILNVRGEAVAAISLAGPIHRLRGLQRPAVQQLKKACAAITHTTQTADLR